MRNLILYTFLVLLSSCSHYGNQGSRNPSSDEGKILVCGEMSMTEDNHTARDFEDVGYTFALDCNKDAKISRDENRVIVQIPITQTNQQQRGWITRFKKNAIAKTKNHAAKPIMCVEANLPVRSDGKSNPCDTKISVLGSKPTFHQSYEYLRRFGYSEEISQKLKYEASN